MTPQIELAERRNLLRSVVAATDTDDTSGLRAALAGATEEDRAALARTLPPSRLFANEGSTRRAAFAVTALGKPKLAAETLAPADRKLSKAYEPHAAMLTPVVIEAAADRTPHWRADFVEQLCGQLWWGEDLVWGVASGLVHDHGVPPTTHVYLSCFVRAVTAIGGDGLADDEHGALMAAAMLADRALLSDFWALFRTEGMGTHFLLTERTAGAWDCAITELAVDPEFRSQVLDATLAALLRDFPARTIAWYIRVHRLLRPAADEVEARQETYLAVLQTAPSTAVGLAQDMLAGAVDRLVVEDVIEASPTVLARTEKKLIRGQIDLLSALQTTEEDAKRIATIMSDAIPGMPLDLAERARKLIGDRRTQAVDGHTRATGGDDVRSATPERGEAVVRSPRRTPLASSVAEAPVALDRDELHELIAAQFEGHGTGADIARILRAMQEHPDHVVDPALVDRGRVIADAVWDRGQVSPRRLLAALLAERAGLPPVPVTFDGWAVHVYASAGETVPDDWQVATRSSVSMGLDDDGNWVELETHRFQSGYRFVQSYAPSALLVAQFHGAPLLEPLPPITSSWRRSLERPGEGVYGADPVIGTDVKPFWTATPDDIPALPSAAVPAEYTFRVQEAREQDGYEQIVGWTGWLLRENPDAFAAQVHPVLMAATTVINVRGVASALTALGSTRQVPGGPTYSALALAASAKMAEHRAQAAEVLAQLAATHLLDPEGFAREIARHLDDGFVMVGRTAQTFADAASIDAITGYRVLQTLAALLPHIVDAVGKPRPQAGKLAELTAHLAAAYGTPVEIPDALVHRQRGTSALAVALRAIAQLGPSTTPLLQQAAAWKDPS